MSRQHLGDVRGKQEASLGNKSSQHNRHDPGADEEIIWIRFFTISSISIH